MRCLRCRGKAVIELRRHHAAYCGGHFLDYFRDQVARAIDRRRMIRPGDRILVAVSGGKDSLALWDVLGELGYAATGLHVALGIGDYSERSRAVTAAFARDRGLELLEVDLAREYGMGVTELSEALRRPPCSGCGQSKRYLFNRTAAERGFDVVATGHNLDDEAATLLGNVLHWKTEYLAKQSPVLENDGSGFVRRVKPLYTLTERESALWCLLRDVAWVEDECPNASGAKSLLYKEVLNRLEDEMPGTKTSFLRGFVERVKPGFSGDAPPPVAHCERCGQPTTGDTCGFCRMWDRARRERSRTAREGAGPPGDVVSGPRPRP